ncbi:MAG: transposase [Treponema sp.]|nr:transposase [Treponema sp.]
MYKKREFFDGAFYHVTSRTNDKIRVFENKLGRKVMLIALQDAKDKFHFRLTNFCVMPTHIHLLIQPADGTKLDKIMHWLKNQSSKRWNLIHGSSDHLWGQRYFARAVKDMREYDFVMDYIDQNPVKAKLSATPAEWKASGAFYKAQNLTDLVDFTPSERFSYVKLLLPITFLVSNLFPPAQLERTLKYYGAYAESLERLYEIVSQMPLLGETKNTAKPLTHLHYYTETENYLIYEYDRQNTMYGKTITSVFPFKTEYQQFNLSKLKSIPNIKLKW